MKKRLLLFTMFSMLLCMSACTGKQGHDTLKGTYAIYIDGYDWGCGTSKVILSLDYPLDEVTPEDFNVTETKKETNWSKPEKPLEEVQKERKVTKAYLSDEQGNEVSDASKYVALELYVSPSDGSPLQYEVATQYNTWSDPYFLTITKSESAKLQSEGTDVKELQIDTAFTEKKTAADAYQVDQFEASDGVSYAYASYKPQEESDTLFVWLHGMGEGGTENTDPYVAALANKTTSFLGEEFQEALGNAHVLIPQCPTYWMDEDGKKSNFIDKKITLQGTSYYESSLMELISSYKEKVGAKKVVLAGCSNGGYMTLLLGLNHPDAFDAIVPICEALPDTLISDEQIQGIKDVPMLFVYSLDDQIVDPTLHEIPTIQRLKDAGASNLHVSEFEHVIDTSGKYKDEDGNPHQYSGHESWIYFENNESSCNECGKKPWQLLGELIQK